MSEVRWQGKLPAYKLNAIPSGTRAIAPAATPQEFQHNSEEQSNEGAVEEGMAFKSSSSPGKLKDMSVSWAGPGQIQEEGNLQNPMEVRH